MAIDKLPNNGLNNSILKNTQSTIKNSIKVIPQPETLSPDKNIIIDLLSISDEAKAVISEEKTLINNNWDKEEFQEMLRMLRETENSENPHINRIKCFKIAMRIMNGDTVPNKDILFLAENEPQMYSNALMLKQNNDNPKKYKTILEDKKGENSIDESSPIPIDSTSENSSEESISIDSVERPVEIKE